MSIEFVICGLEHSGTTLISDLFRQVKGLDSGFEVGVLLAESPQKFQEVQPFAKNILGGWDITVEELSDCCSAANYSEFYSKLKRVSAVLDDDTQLIFDKTPRYLLHIGDCLQRIDVPFIASYKDPRAIVHSDFKRSGADVFENWYDEYLPKKHGYLKNCYTQFELHKNDDRVSFVSLENLALDARNTMDRMFSHVGFEFDLDYILLSGLRYSNTRSTAVSIPIAFSYLSDFDSARMRKIEKDFQEFDSWFYC